MARIVKFLQGVADALALTVRQLVNIVLSLIFLFFFVFRILDLAGNNAAVILSVAVTIISLVPYIIGPQGLKTYIRNLVGLRPTTYVLAILLIVLFLYRPPPPPNVTIIAKAQIGMYGGPNSVQYPLIATLEKADARFANGRSADGQWLQAELPGGTPAWVERNRVEITGDANALPIASSPTVTYTFTPSYTPTFTATWTPTSTDTPTSTNTPSSTPTYTSTATITPSYTPTNTPSVTSTLTDTPTAMPVQVNLIVEFVVDTSSAMLTPVANGDTRYEMAMTAVARIADLTHQEGVQTVWRGVRVATGDGCDQTYILEPSGIAVGNEELLAPFNSLEVGGGLNSILKSVEDIPEDMGLAGKDNPNAVKVVFILFGSFEPHPDCGSQTNLIFNLGVLKPLNITTAFCFLGMSVEERAFVEFADGVQHHQLECDPYNAQDQEEAAEVGASLIETKVSEGIATQQGTQVSPATLDSGKVVTAVWSQATAVTWTPTFTPTITRTPTTTYTPSTTPSQTLTFTPTPSRTPTITLTPSVTVSPSNTPENPAPPTATYTPSETPSPTWTPSPTSTLTLTPINSGFVVITPPANSVFFNPPKNGYIFTTYGEKANVRSDATDKSTVIGQLDYDTQVQVQAELGDWYYIGNGWVHRNLIRYGEGNAAEASATVEAIKSYTPPPPPPPDKDSDGFIDNQDDCPDIAGLAPNGCPEQIGDKDGDGMKDNEDSCPDAAGSPPSGCPQVGDSDGDGFLDGSDVCPSQHGGQGSTNGCPVVSGPSGVSISVSSPGAYGTADHGEGCTVSITITVTGSQPATGNLHVGNAFYGPEGDIHGTMTFPVGTSSFPYPVTLGGNQPQYASHAVWFTSNIGTSNTVGGLVCSNLPW